MKFQCFLFLNAVFRAVNNTNIVKKGQAPSVRGTTRPACGVAQIASLAQATGYDPLSIHCRVGLLAKGVVAG
ncbi:MAG: hypothetical protein ACP5PS_06550 [Bacteroidales bacterium]